MKLAGNELGVKGLFITNLLMHDGLDEPFLERVAHCFLLVSHYVTFQSLKQHNNLLFMIILLK